MIPSVYINLEDDVAKVMARLKKEKSAQLVLVCPKRCQLFSDSINLRLLKKQADLLKKEVSILTMDERGQLYAQEAGFALRSLPKSKRTTGISDIGFQPKSVIDSEKEQEHAGRLAQTVKGVASFVSGLVSKKNTDSNSEDAAFTEKPGVESFSSQQESVKTKDFPRAHSLLARKPQKPSVRVDRELAFSANGRDPGKTRRAYSIFLSLSLAMSLLVVLGLVFAVLPKASVFIFPKTEPITRDFDVSLDNQAKQYDSAKLILPTVKFEESLDVNSKFKSQGKKDVGNKAFGAIHIYNFTGKPLNLKAQTTSLIAGSKTYYLVNDALQIAPTKYRNAQTKEIDENSLDPPLEIIAGSGGEDSNLPAGVRMEITNQVFGSRPLLLYAKTQTPVSGGTSRFLSVVTDSDILDAQNQLGILALRQVEEKLAPQGLKFVENSFRVEVLEFFTDKQPGAESPQFQASAKFKIVGLAFS